jgi:hypothetical protein
MFNITRRLWLGAIPFFVVAPLGRWIDSTAIYSGLLGASLVVGMLLACQFVQLVELKDIEKIIDEYHNRY